MFREAKEHHYDLPLSIFIATGILSCSPINSPRITFPNCPSPKMISVKYSHLFPILMSIPSVPIKVNIYQ